MKLEIIAQANGQEMNLTNLDKEVKEQIKAAGLKLGSSPQCVGR